MGSEVVLGSIFTIVGILAITVGLACSWQVFRDIQTGLATKHWQRGIGVIRHSEVLIESDSDGTSHQPVIKYTYFVDGIQYQSQTIRICHRALFSLDGGVAHTDRMVSTYPINKQVVVYYQPNRPQHSVLEPGLHEAFSLLVRLTAGILAILSGASCFYTLYSIAQISGHWWFRSLL
jgi:Protein of unknown function (DUF3592)